MARRLTTEDLVLNIIVNSNKAQSEIGRLSRAMVDAKSKLSAAEEEMKRLERAGQTNSARYRQLQNDVRNYNSVISDSRRRLGELNQTLSLQDKSLQQLEQSLRRTRQLWRQATNDADRQRYAQEMELLNRRIRELRDGGEQTGNALLRMSSKIQRYFAVITAGIASLMAAFSGVKKATDEYAKFDDTLADVMKTTNLAKESARLLNAELERFDTRTSQQDLLGLARIAGKLGYSEISDITEFVRANNQIIVALNEDLGGNVEETVNKIGKLVDVFKLKELYDTEEAFLKVGSAINELGMASTANEGYMVEFARRMAGVAPLAGITIEQILGLGAALDQLGQTEEVSSTALSKLFLAIAKDAVTYSKYAKMEINDFKNLLEKDFMAAFTKVLQGVKGSSDGINELAATLGDLGQDGGRVIGVIGSLANNVDILTTSIDLSSSAMSQGTSITDEYNIKNETAAAQLDRKRKEVNKLWRELGQKLWPAISSGNSLLIVFIRTLTTLIGFIANNIGVISTLTFAIVAYYTAVQVAAKWEIITTTYMATKRTVIIALSGAWALLTGNISRATAAQRLLNITMSANPYGLAAAALVGVTAWLINIANRLSDAERAQERVNDEMSKAKEISDGLKTSTQELNSVIHDLALTRYEQAKAFYELQKLYPDLLKDMSLEEYQAKGAAESLRELNEARLEEEKAIVRSRYEKAVKNVEELTKKYNQLKEAIGGNQSGGLTAQYKKVREQLALANEELTQYGKKVDEINRIEFNARPVAEKLEYYHRIRDGLVEQLNMLEKQAESIESMNRGWHSFSNWVNNIRMDGLVSQLNAVNKQIASLTPKTNAEREKEIKTIGDRRKALSEELEVLKSQYELINEKDLPARRKNLAERKKIQSQLDALDGNSTRGAANGEDARRKAYKKELDDAEKHHQNVLRREGLFREDLSELTNEQLVKMVEYNNQYQAELDRINNKYGENLKTVTNNAEKELKKRLFDQEKYREEVLLKEKSLLDQEKIAHNERLKQAGIYGKNREELEGDHLKAYDALLKQHHANIDAIEDNAIAVDLEKKKKAYERDLKQLKTKHKRELAEITTLDQAKQVLRGTISAQELAEIKTLDQARDVIREQQFNKEKDLTRGHLEDLAELFKQAIASGEFDGMKLSAEQLEIFKDNLIEVEALLADLLEDPDRKNKRKKNDQNKVDIFGMSQDDWTRIIDNIRKGKFELEDLYSVLASVTEMFSSYSNLVAQKENAMLQKDYDANERKKENLRRRLDDGTLTQESYNKQVEKLDRDMDKKRAEIQRKQAKREKAMALMSAIVNTARAVTAVLPNWILAALVGAFGAIQIGTIAATPLPSVEGRESGGYLKVERSQDGKVFNAKVDPDRRGFVQEPTVIVGENGSEWVASAQAVQNPTVRPILDVLDTAQRNGTISTLNLQEVIAGTLGRRSVQGREVGGYVNRESQRADNGHDQRIYEVLSRLDGTVDKLTVGLKNLKAEVAIIGKNGFLEKWTEYNQTVDDANL